MSTIDRINHPSRTQPTDASRPAAGAKQAKGLVAKDKLDLETNKAEDAQKQVESEFAARKAAILRREAAGGYDPDKAMDYISKRLASGRVEHR
jgi:hypothetical protein